MNTRYTALTAEQKLALTSDEFNTAIQLEAAERGIPIPISYADAINQMGYVGYSVPADSVSFYEIIAPNSYGGGSSTGICYKTEEDAVRALQGAICVREDGYGASKRNKFVDGEFTVQRTTVCHSKASSFITGVKQHEDDTAPYMDLCTEAHKDLSEIRQAKYDADVAAAKRQKYLELANGDEKTAQRFWNNLERGEWSTKPKVEATELEATF